MRLIALAASLALLAAACGGGETTATTEAPTTRTTPTATTPTTTTLPPDPTTTTGATTTTTGATTTAPETGTEGSALVIASIDFDAGIVVIRNDGASDYDLTGHFICNRPSYASLPLQVLAAGEEVEIDAAAIGLSAGSGEVALYTSNAFDDPGSILRYVQWGSASHGRTSVAVSAGIWTDGDFVDNADGNLASTGSDPVSSADWASG